MSSDQITASVSIVGHLVSVPYLTREGTGILPVVGPSRLSLSERHRKTTFVLLGRNNSMDPLTMVGLLPLMEITDGRPDIGIGFIDGPVASGNLELAGERIRRIGPPVPCSLTSAACAHGTFIARILSAKRESTTRGICPDAHCWYGPFSAKLPWPAMILQAPRRKNSPRRC